MTRAILFVMALVPTVTLANDWQADPVWHDGLVEKATYAASRVVYGKPRAYTAAFFTNKEQHDRGTLTKAEKSKDAVEVWKFNCVETIPTPNYPYHYVTTAHATVGSLQLTRLDCSSQEFCGTSFKQYLLKVWPGVTTGVLDYFAFSYMPEAGRVSRAIENAVAVPVDALPLYLRNYDFAKHPDQPLRLLPSQRSNRATASEPFMGTIKYAGEEGESYKLELHVAGEAAARATYWMAKDRRHVMLKYAGPEGQAYELKSLERVNYWTIKGE